MKKILIVMESLDQLINKEEQRIEQLTRLRSLPVHAIKKNCTDQDSGNFEYLDYNIEKAYEKLAIYKIRKSMGF
jgi:hydrogenase maturation factor HypE